MRPGSRKILSGKDSFPQFVLYGSALFIALQASLTLFLPVITHTLTNNNEGLSGINRRDIPVPKKKYIMHVISLQNVTGAPPENQGRLDAFRKEWAEICGNDPTTIEFRQCPGEMDERRGVGLTRAYIKCFDLALKESSLSSENAFVFLEDDARLFNSQFCSATYRQSLWSSIPEDAFLLLLGGHTWKYADEISSGNVPFRESTFSYGTYGFVLPSRDQVLSLKHGYQWHLHHPLIDFENKPIASPDKYLYQHVAPTNAQRSMDVGKRSKIYVTNPLIVYHKAGYSNTWKGWREEENGQTLLEEDTSDVVKTNTKAQDSHTDQVTGAFANCSMQTSSEDLIRIRQQSKDADPGSGVAFVSCTPLRFRAPEHSFKESGEIIAGVLSESKSKSRRKAIRSTWANGRKGVFFLVAGPWSEVAEEFEKYADLIWIDEEENYFNIGHKTALLLKIVDQLTTELGVQYSYVLKTDDDSYVALDRLKAHLDFLEEAGTKPDYWGRCHGKRVEPDRRRESKYYISNDEYPEPFFARYCQGAGFALSRAFVHCAAASGHIENTRHLKFEDVFVGLLGERCGVSAIHDAYEWSLRTYRTGYLEKDFFNERERILKGPGAKGVVRIPKAEMAGRLIQHRITSDSDMFEHHASALDPRLIYGLSGVVIGEVVEFYYDDHYRWLKGEVFEVKQQSPNEGERHPVVTLRFEIDGKFEKFPFVPFYGRWRKPMANQIPRTSLAWGPKTSPRPSLSDLLLDRFIVVPEYKLLFCYTEKNACSMFNHLFRMLRLFHPSLKDKPDEAAFQANGTWFRNTPVHHGLERIDLERILQNPEWKKAVFYRDPLARFLSAFRSKCEGGDHDGFRSCKRTFGKRSISFADAISHLDEKGNSVFSDQHFIPMSHFCGSVANNLDYYDFVSEVTPDGSEKDVEALLQLIGVEQNVSRFLIDSVVRTGGTNLEKDREVVQRLHGVVLAGDHSQKQSHNTHSGAMKMMKSYFRDRRAVMIVQNAYGIDYETFNITRSTPSSRVEPRILIGITTSRRLLGDRVAAVTQTWAKNLPPNVVLRYFVGDLVDEASFRSGSSEDVKTLASKAGIADHSAICVLPGVLDDEYPLVRKAAAVIKQMETLVQTHLSFDWIVDADDDTYINLRGLRELLSEKDPRENHYLGRRGYGRPEIRETLRQGGLDKPYCMGGPGFILSKPALHLLSGAIDDCIEDAKAASVPLMDDIIIGLCMKKIATLGCSDGIDGSDDAFVQAYSPDDLSDDQILNAVTIHEFKEKGTMENFHQRYLHLYQRNLFSADMTSEAEIVYFDKDVMRNVMATYQGAASWVEWPNASVAGNISRFESEPLMATVDRRPTTVRRQMALDKHGLHDDGRLLGCAILSNTFVSDLRDISLEQTDEQLIETKAIAATCDVCFQFSSQKDMDHFVPTHGYMPSSSSTKCFGGVATVTGRFANWQKKDERFPDYGYPWTVDCALSNGIRELTCTKISNIQDELEERDDIQKIYFRSKISFRNQQATSFHVHSRWPWAALQSHDDDRSHIAARLPRHFRDTSSSFVPDSARHLKLAHVEGPGYTMTGGLSLESTTKMPPSLGGIHSHFLVNILHLLRNAPGSTHIIGVVDGQAHQSYQQLLNLLHTKINALYPRYGRLVFSDAQKLSDGKLLPKQRPETNASAIWNDDLTLMEVLRLRKMKIHVVPLTTPALALEKSVCGAQYAFAPYIAARFAADYHVILYADSDAVVIESSETLQDIFYERFFANGRTQICAGHRFRIMENFVKPEDENTDRLLQCVEENLLDKRRLSSIVENCQDLKPGHIVGRTDSISSFDVHHVRAGTHLPRGVEDCSDNDSKLLLDVKEVFELHLRGRQRKGVCTCFASLDQSVGH